MLCTVLGDSDGSPENSKRRLDNAESSHQVCFFYQLFQILFK